MSHFRHRARLCAATALMAGLLGGCATSPDTPGPGSRPSPEGAASGTVVQELLAQHERWRGTRYRLGGLGARGIDCSGLTYVVYRDLFGERLPRTTEGQGGIGQAVQRQALAPGDLVFFKTGVFQKHVGIYVEDGKFLHASRRSGVRLSSLEKEYWRERYWKARRPSVIQAGL